MKKSTTLSRKVKNYTLLASSILASSMAAKAQIIYTDVDPDQEIGGVIPDTYPTTVYDSIDLNNDGLFDFKMTLSITGTNSNPNIPGFSFHEVMDGFFNAANAIFTYSVEYAPIVFKMECGDSVPQGNQLYGLNYAVFSFQNSTFKAGNWNDEHDQYVGVKCTVDGETHYGWIRIDVNTKDTLPNIVVKEYAYEATANKKIEVCDTGGFGVGIHEIQNQQGDVTVFPNPSRGNCRITLNEKWQGDIQMSVRDVSGKEVFATNFESNGQKRELPFDFSQLSSGLYFIHFKSAENSVAVKWTKL
jgi:hypothetical protein